MRTRLSISRIDLAVGNIAEPDLGLADASRIKSETSEIFHLAAVYDLGAPRELAMQVNVNGTRNVLDFAEGSFRAAATALREHLLCRRKRAMRAPFSRG